MAHRRISDEEFIDTALELFRARGVEGVSLSHLAQATGLEKASLYYRYPGGKEEIVLAIVGRVVQWFDENVFVPLKSAGTPQKRVETVAESLRAFYGNGSKPCVTDVFSIDGGSDARAAALKTAMGAWLAAFGQIAQESGLPESVARQRAEEAVVGIEGALVVSRVLGDTAPFERSLHHLPRLLTKP